VLGSQAAEVPAPHDRDEALRAAHRRAFAKMREARSSTDNGATVRAAVEDLVEACEAYTLHR
jgi:hypothetical protein